MRAIRDVRAGDWVEHPPHEGERDVGRLERGDPALGMAHAIAHVTDQAVRDQLATAVAQGLPDIGAVGRRVEACCERWCQGLAQQLLAEQRADLRPLLGIQQGGLDRLGAVQVGVQAAVEQMDGDEVDGESSVRAAR